MSDSKTVDTANAVSFSNDIELQTETRRKSIADLAPLSQSSKAWDLDGDGELDEAELALKGLDQSRRGTLNKEQMHSLMQDNLKTQRDLFKAKKVVFGLVAFTCVLTLSNFATAFAAAFLAKDTKSSKDNLTDAKTGRTLATQTTKETFTIAPEFDELFSRQRHLCNLYRRELAGSVVSSNANGMGVVSCEELYSMMRVSLADAEAMIEICDNGGTVSIKKSFFSSKKFVTHQICPPPVGSTIVMEYGRYAVLNPDLVFTIRSDISAYTWPDGKTGYGGIFGLQSPVGGYCEDNLDCAENLLCEEGGGLCQARVFNSYDLALKSWSFPYADGKSIIQNCINAEAVSIKKIFEESRTVDHDICPPPHPGMTFEMNDDGGLIIRDKGNVSWLSIQPSADGGTFTIAGIKSNRGQHCDVDTDCVEGLICILALKGPGANGCSASFH